MLYIVEAAVTGTIPLTGEEWLFFLENNFKNPSVIFSFLQSFFFSIIKENKNYGTKIRPERKFECNIFVYHVISRVHKLN